jgi:succinate dehydrogenase/fumarate reductase cytochrome b subunit
MKYLFPKIVVFFLVLTLLVGGTIMLLSSVSFFEAFNGLNGIMNDGIQNIGETLAKTWLSS